MQHIQRPTCVNIRIRSTQDAHKIFYAVQRGILQMVTRRLDADERLALRSGCIYAWEERGPHTEITGLGIERFTEGRRWSPSRVRDEFLFYYEKYTPSTDGNQRANDSKLPPRDWDPLVKQTYSVYVDTTKGRRKWHLTAYFTQATVDQLGTVDDIDGVGNLEVPDGLFKSTRVGKGRKNEEGPGRVGESSTAAASTVTRTYAPFHNPYTSNPNHPGTPPGSQPLQMYQPYPNTHFSSAYYPPSTEYSPAPTPPQRILPPPLSSGTSYTSTDSAARLPTPAAPHYNDYTRPAALSTSAWAPPASAPRSADSPFYPSAAPSPGPYSPTASYHSPPGHHSRIPQPQTVYLSNSSRHSAVSSQSPPPSWSEEVIIRHQASEINRTDLRTPIASRPYEPPYAYAPHSSADGSISRSRSPHTASSSLSPGFAPLSIPPIVTHDTGMSYEPPSPTSSMDSEERRGTSGARRVDLAPLHALQRSHPYRRDPVDDRTLRLLGPRTS